MSVKSLAVFFTIGAAVASAATVERPREIHITIPRRSELTPVQKLNRDGVDAVLHNRYEKAEGLFFKAYLYDPADPFTLNNIGYVSELQGQVERAEKFYKLAEEQGCDAVIERSTTKNLKGKPMMDALGGIQNVPMRINRINVVGMGLLAEGRPFEAVTTFQQALELDPQNAFTLNNMGVASEATGDLESAVKFYDQAAALHSKQPVVVTAKRSSRGKPVSELASASANDVRTRMATMTPEEVHAEMLTVRGVAEINANNWEAAKKDFVEAFQLDPKNAFALNNAGYVAERDGELEIARSYYSRAQSARDANARIGFASDLAAQGKQVGDIADASHSGVDNALDSYSRSRLGRDGLIRLHPRNPSATPESAAPDTKSPDAAAPDTKSPEAAPTTPDQQQTTPAQPGTTPNQPGQPSTTNPPTQQPPQ